MFTGSVGGRVGVRSCGVEKRGVRRLVSAEFGFGMMGRFWR